MTPVSELLALKIENAVLRLQALEASHRHVEEEKNALLRQAIAETGASPEHVYDVQARVFRPKDGPRPLSAPQKRERKRVA